MKTPKTAFLIFIISLAFGSKPFAQQWYLVAGGGYGFPVAGEVLENQSLAGSVSMQYSYTTLTQSFGAGFKTGISGGYMFNKNFGVELGFSYLDGSTTTVSLVSYYYYNNLNYTNYIENVAMSGTMFRMTPAFRFQYGEKKFKPYVVFGFIAALSESAKLVDTYSAQFPAKTGTFSGGKSFGFHGAIGTRFMFSEKVAAFIEFAVDYQNYAPQMLVYNNGNTVNYNSTGGGYIGGVGGGTATPPVYLPFSSLGVNAGIQFSFVKPPPPPQAHAK